MSAVGDARKRQSPTPVVELIKRLINAWDCCGTCAGGVLAERDRELKSAAWDEGFEAALTARKQDAVRWRVDNPYRGAS